MSWKEVVTSEAVRELFKVTRCPTLFLISSIPQFNNLTQPSHLLTSIINHPSTQSTNMKSIFIVLGALTLAYATPVEVRKGRFSIPEGSPDGLYVHTEHQNGTITMEYLGLGPTGKGPNDTLATMEDVTSLSSTAKRAPQGAYCQAGTLDDYGAYWSRVGLENWCGDGHYFGSSIGFISNGVTSYGCNYGSGQVCHQGDVTGFLNQVVTTCGLYTPGWYSKPAWKASYGITAARSYC